jgi:hypothetical protein
MSNVRAHQVKHAAMPTYMEPQWFFPLFVVMWFTVCGLLAHLSGWRSLAGRYLAQSTVEGERFRFSSGSLGAIPWFPVSYSNCLFITVSKAGLGVSLLFLFRFLSPPLFVPWAQVESVQEKTGFFGRRAVVQFKNSAVKLTLFGRAASGLLAAHAKVRAGSAL